MRTLAGLLCGATGFAFVAGSSVEGTIQSRRGGPRDDVPSTIGASHEPSKLRLIENRGQWPAHVHFAARLPGALVRAERAAIGLQLYRGTAGRDAGVHVRLVFDGASESASPAGIDRQEGNYNYFIGNDPAQWQSDVPCFGGVRYTDLYPGIDLVLRGAERGLKYDLYVDPGADLERVVLCWEGLDDVRPMDDGTLDMFLSIGTLQHVPGACWQELPSGERRPIECAWRRIDGNSFGIDAPGRDPTLPLVIDPELLWSTYLGSAAFNGTGDWVSAVAVDADGNVFVTGNTDGDDFPQTPGTFRYPTGGIEKMFVTKFRGDGMLAYSSVFGAVTHQQRALDVAVDLQSRVTVVGRTLGDDFPTTPGAYDTEKTAPSFAPSGFVLQLTTSGNGLRFSTYLEDPDLGAQIYTVGIHPDQGVVVGGGAHTGNFPTTSGAFQTQGAGGDGFITRFDPTGSSLVWSTLLGGTAAEAVNELAVDQQGAVTASGRTGSDDFPTTPGAFSNVNGANSNLFVSRLSPQGDSLIWSTYVGGTTPGENDFPRGIAVDPSGSVFIAGLTNSPTFPTTPHAFQPTKGATTNSGFLTRLNASGSALIYSTFWGEDSLGSVTGVRVDASGVATTCGAASGLIATTPGAFDTSHNGSIEASVARFAPRGDRLFYSSYLGGSSTDVADGLATTAEGRVTVGGYSNGGYPTTVGSFQPNYVGGQTDGFVTTLDLFLEGVASHGYATPSCRGPLTANATEMPAAGAQSFSIYCSGAPPWTTGWLLVGQPDSQRTDVSGAGIWLDPSQPISRLPVVTGPDGYAEVPLPLPLWSSGRELTCQFLMRNTATCPGSGTFSASNGLRVTVQ